MERYSPYPLIPYCIGHTKVKSLGVDMNKTLPFLSRRVGRTTSSRSRKPSYIATSSSTKKSNDCPLNDSTLSALQCNFDVEPTLLFIIISSSIVYTYNTKSALSFKSPTRFLAYQYVGAQYATIASFTTLNNNSSTAIILLPNLRRHYHAKSMRVLNLFFCAGCNIISTISRVPISSPNSCFLLLIHSVLNDSSKTTIARIPIFSITP